MTTKTMMGLMTMATALAVGACGGAPGDEVNVQKSDLAVQAASAGPTLLAWESPSGLVSSTGNLYWTSYAINEFGPDSATVWRASKGNTPGSEHALYTESGDRSGFYFFGSIVWALEGTYYGYFSANYNDNGVPTSQIKRVPLAGGPATIIAHSPAYIGTRDVATDGTSLYWADAGGVRKVPVGGGAVTTLATTTTTAHIGLDATHVYFEQGAHIQRVLKTGGAVSTVVAAPANVTAFYVDASSGYIYWGEHGAAVRRQLVTGGNLYTYQSPIAGHDVTSVGFDGSRTLWIDCTEPGNSTCYVRAYIGGGSTLTVNAGAYSVGSGHLQWDTASLYWGDASGLKKFVY